jgi:hypothetical protein
MSSRIVRACTLQIGLSFVADAAWERLELIAGPGATLADACRDCARSLSSGRAGLVTRTIRVCQTPLHPYVWD